MTTFLLGAGFNIDANAYKTDLRYDYGYPLAGALADICFDPEDRRRTDNVEELFQEAIQNHKSEPIRKLSDRLMEADYWIAPAVASRAETPYLKLLDRFPGAHFITFNYDSLVEVLLFKREEWRPETGYGIPVMTQTDASRPAEAATAETRRKVIHLHGSLCVYISDFELVSDSKSPMQWLKLLPEPVFHFDPESITNLFIPYSSGPLGPSYSLPPERIIAPIPDKAEGLKGVFVRAAYEASMEILEKTELLICVGYNFSESDSISYAPILMHAEKQRVPVMIVSPAAKAISKRLLSKGYSKVAISETTFAGWADSGFAIL